MNCLNSVKWAIVERRSEVKRDFVAKIKGKIISQVLVEFVFYLCVPDTWGWALSSTIVDPTELTGEKMCMVMVINKIQLNLK